MNHSEITAAHRDRILDMPGITGIHTGVKVTNGVSTGIPAVVISVRQKGVFAKGTEIPKELDGVATDVVEEEIFPLVGGARYDPILAGCSIGASDFGGGGTLGLLVIDNFTLRPALLSNYHVLYRDGSGFDNDSIVQPGANDSGSMPNDAVGRNIRGFVSDTVDAAICSVFGRQLDPAIIAIGSIVGAGTPLVSDSVSKYGRTTGLTSGTITAVDYSTNISYPTPLGVKRLINQIRFEGSAGMVLPGDSGSAIITGTTVVGLLVGSKEGGALAVASPILQIFSELNIHLFADTVGVILSGTDVEAVNTATDINMEGSYLASWEIFGKLVMQNLDSDITIGVAEDEGLVDAFTIRFTGFNVDDTQSFTITTPTGSDTGGSESFPMGTVIIFSLYWNHDTHTLTGTVETPDGPRLVASDVLTGTPSLTTPYHPIIVSAGTGGDYIGDFDTLRIGADCGDDPFDMIDGPWHIRNGTFNFGGGLFIEQTNVTVILTGSALGVVETTNPVLLAGNVDGFNNFTFVMTIDRGGHERSFWEIGLQEGSTSDDAFDNSGGISVVYSHNGAHIAANRVLSIEFGDYNVTNNAGSLSTLFLSDLWTITITWDRSTGTGSILVSDQHGNTSSHGSTGISIANYTGDDFYLGIHTTRYIDSTSPPHISVVTLEDLEA